MKELPRPYSNSLPRAEQLRKTNLQPGHSGKVLYLFLYCASIRSEYKLTNSSTTVTGDALQSQSNYRSAVNGDVRRFLDQSSTNRRPSSPQTSGSAANSPSARGPIDARSLGINAGKTPGNVIRPNRIRSIRGGNNKLAGAPAGRRHPGAKGAAGRGGRGGSSSQRGGGDKRRARRGGRDEEEGGDAKTEKEVAEYYKEKQEEERPKPVRYEPEEYNVDNLQATWPSLPIGQTAAIGSVAEKLAWMGGRLANDYVPKEELAKRVFDKQRVLFRSEEEKVEVMGMVEKMENERAEKLTERKGQVVKAEDVSFQPLTDEERKDLVGKLATGDYPKLEQTKPDAHPAVGDILRNLRNNETYQTPESSQFMAKLETLLPKPGQARAKRAAARE